MVSDVLPDSVISCTNLLCDNPEHKECLDNFLRKMVDNLVKCRSHIPKTKAPTSNNKYLCGLSMSNNTKMMPFSGKGSGINLVSHPKD